MAESWVVDCSVIAAFLLDESEGVAFDPLIEAAGAGRVELVVPSLFWFELLNVFVVAERRGRVTPEQAAKLRNESDHLPVKTEPDIGVSVRRRIHELASAHSLTAYDAAYLELADRLGARLKTLDPDLLRLQPDYPWIE